MTDPTVEATRKRAALRGEEAVARWRIKGGAWAARVYAVVTVAPVIASILWTSETVGTIIATGVIGAVIFGLSFPIARGNLRAAIVLSALFCLDKGAAIALNGARGVFQGLLIAIAIAFGLVQGVWGAIELRRIVRARSDMEPAAGRPSVVS